MVENNMIIFTNSHLFRFLFILDSILILTMSFWFYPVISILIFNILCVVSVIFFIGFLIWIGTE